MTNIQSPKSSGVDKHRKLVQLKYLNTKTQLNRFEVARSGLNLNLTQHENPFAAVRGVQTWLGCIINDITTLINVYLISN